MADYKTVPIGQIVPRGTQVRQNFDRDFLEELKDSLKNDGVLCPLLVREVDGKLEIIAGEQRWKAAKNAGIKEVPVVVINVDSARAVELAFIENEKRRNLHGWEREDAAYAMWLSKNYKTKRELAVAVGMSEERLKTLLSDYEIRKGIKVSGAEHLPSADIEELAPISGDKKTTAALAKAMVENKLSSGGSGGTLRKAVRILKDAHPEARPAIVKAIADEEITSEEAEDIAGVAEDGAQVKDLVHAKKTHGSDELRKTTSVIRRSKERGEAPAPIRTIVKSNESEWNSVVETLGSARSTLFLVSIPSLKKMNPGWKKDARGILMDIDKYIAKALDATKEG